MGQVSGIRFALTGAILIAISFGLARFAFGLFVPQIRADLEISANTIGVIAALPLISFVVISLVAPLVTKYFGARNTTVLSALFSVFGLALVSQATGPISLAVGVFACGICTGLMMPALTSAMQALVDRSIHGRVSSVMNAGTSIGVALSVPAVLFLVGAWRYAYLSFTVIAIIGVLLAWFLIPSVSRLTPSNAAPPPKIKARQWWRLLKLSLFAFAMGFIASAYWTFGPDLVTTLGSLSSKQSGWLWLALGIAGLGGAIISDLADRNNPAITHALMLMMLTTSLTLLAASPSQVYLAVFSALIFGLAYMSLTGLYLMTGIRLLPGRLSMGPVLPFVACALGQAAGSPIIGLLVGEFGYAESFSIFAAVGVFISLISPFYPGHTEHEDDIPEEETGLQAAYNYQLQDEEGEPLESTSTEQ
ncbi:Predicted arabinose efflux permease, MFS family [Pseudidiomarina planktonica]|uniref:Predicted arabinose efflux permease, MFS family n=1 Tax=Pseudidiomarina planktonica TaxID=1323738 RepID=A0A1Y6FXE5_9GAMM|nr:MFS transporter [Pseudidiomarina planktonica]RUO63297.1 MFS transporter [Pseudidiomarina planktonica]SMQ80485.1 Predicted arabinose efflux permease, MFS family [Pseudidiomarina planktonica]